MNQLNHEEKHFTGGEAVRDVVIGMSDGLTVPFTSAALAGFGFIEGIYTGTSAMRSAGQTLLIGGLAAAAAFLIASFFA